MIASRGWLFLMERRFEVFINAILFKQIIQDAIVGEISEKMIPCLIRAEMVLMNVHVGKTLLLQEIQATTLVLQWKVCLKQQ